MRHVYVRSRCGDRRRVMEHVVAQDFAREMTDALGEADRRDPSSADSGRGTWRAGLLDRVRSARLTGQRIEREPWRMTATRGVGVSEDLEGSLGEDQLDGALAAGSADHDRIGVRDASIGASTPVPADQYRAATSAPFGIRTVDQHGRWRSGSGGDRPAAWSDSRPSSRTGRQRRRDEIGMRHLDPFDQSGHLPWRNDTLIDLVGQS